MCQIISTEVRHIIRKATLIIVDECHRGSARDESNWREILEYFEPAYQVGMTATSSGFEMPP
jgi:type I site-specific restriction endonuclease